jgi:outer membrane immunogenic protein
MKEYWLAAIALPVLVAGPAAAADMVLRGSASPVAPLSWTGCYAGANVGWVGSRDEITLAPSGNYLNPAGAAPPPNVAGTGLNSRGPALVTNSYSNRISGIEAGPQVGCNWQTGDFVFGGEADIQWTNLNNRVDANFGPITAANAAFTIAPHTEHVTSRLDWLSTVRARAGIAVEGVLLYVTGGLAIGGLQSDTAVTFGTFPVLPVFNAANHLGSISTTRTGWVAGVGGEYAIDANWSIKAEYLYVDLGSYAYNSPLVAPAGVAAGYSWSTNVRERDQMARIGVNYRWGGPDRTSY